MATNRALMAMGVNLQAFRAEMWRVGLAFLSALPPTLLLSAVAGWLVSRRALGPVSRVTETAARITAQDLSKRIPARTEDKEFEDLITVLNQMLERLDASYQQAVRFSADAAHELKTPLTVLQGELEAALRESPADSESQRRNADLMGEVVRLRAIVEKLLLLARADAGQLQLRLESVDLAELVRETADDLTILAPNLTIRMDLADSAPVRADQDLLRQVLQNLASNAVKYSCDGGTVTLMLSTGDSGVCLEVANTGETVPEADRERIFDRFHRGDKSRGRRVEGVGLGLSLAREIVSAHGGRLELKDSRNGLTTFALTLPAHSALPEGAHQ
jgi:heavy metal sensor kinase